MTAAGQSLITLVRFGRTGLALRVALWMVRNMQDPDGFWVELMEKPQH